MKIILATSNPHKLQEIKAIAKNINFDLDLVGNDFSPKETGSTFKENSYIKAYEAAKLTGLPSLADDSGLCINALDGAPGIFSSRYAPSNQERIKKVLINLEGEPDRSAFFECNMTLVNHEGKVLFSSEGRIDGVITQKPIGKNGFGYDPIFFVPELNKTMAQMSSEEKNIYSHRAKALLPMIEYITKNF